VSRGCTVGVHVKEFGFYGFADGHRVDTEYLVYRRCLVPCTPMVHHVTSVPLVYGWCPCAGIRILWVRRVDTSGHHVHSVRFIYGSVPLMSFRVSSFIQWTPCRHQCTPRINVRAIYNSVPSVSF
jgi:hypothetical protein